MADAMDTYESGCGMVLYHTPAWADIPDATIQLYSPNPDEVFRVRIAKLSETTGQVRVSNNWAGKDQLAALTFTVDTNAGCLVGGPTSELANGWKISQMRIYRLSNDLFLDILHWTNSGSNAEYTTAYIWPWRLVSSQWC
jgi:hypothetical protein